MHLLFSFSSLPTTLTNQNGPNRDHSIRKGSRKRREGEHETQERKRKMTVREVASTRFERGGKHGRARQKETRKPAGGKRRHTSQQEAKESTQGRGREREARKAAGMRGRHPREAEVGEGKQERQMEAYNPEGSTQASRSKRDTHKPARGRGKHAS